MFWRLKKLTDSANAWSIACVIGTGDVVEFGRVRSGFIELEPQPGGALRTILGAQLVDVEAARCGAALRESVPPSLGHSAVPAARPLDLSICRTALVCWRRQIFHNSVEDLAGVIAQFQR
ncbi:hypothetical protein [Paraburkholderia sabiae]|uniref:hypothetical protein n=1 Tax=Paraburkholderia sabiae TaxID=273251 RepID=UPI001CC37D70|nr:hypothetical protein [Paraburkholderia sabiae]